MQQPEPPDNRYRSGSSAAIISLALRSLSATAEVFVHKPDSFGEHYAGFQVAIGAVYVLCFAAYSGEGAFAVLCFLIAYMTMLNWVRFHSWRRSKKPIPQPHSQYAGTPRIMRLLPWFKQETVAHRIEPPMVMGIGLAIAMMWHPALGMYIFLAGCGLLLAVDDAISQEKERASRMRDAYLEHKACVERMRDMLEGK